MKTYQIKIAIKNSHPPIWRRVLVPDGLTFSQLSLIINEAMGWASEHLYCFTFRNLRIEIEESAEADLWSDFSHEDTLDASETYINEFMEAEKWFSYTYDFGDNWEHRIDVEKTYEELSVPHPEVTKWKGNCPPEDSGGIWNYDPEEESCEQSPYDQEAVNGFFKENCHVIWGEGETRAQWELFEGFWKGETGLKASVDAEKADEIGRHEARDLAHREEFIKELYELRKARPMDYLSDILRALTRNDLKERARALELTGVSSLKKDLLIARIKERMLEPEMMRRTFTLLSDLEIGAFEKALGEGNSCKVQAEEYRMYVTLLQGAYIGMTMDSRIVVPSEVAEGYAQLNTEAFHRERKAVS